MLWFLIGSVGVDIKGQLQPFWNPSLCHSTHLTNLRNNKIKINKDERFRLHPGGLHLFYFIQNWKVNPSQQDISDTKWLDRKIYSMGYFTLLAPTFVLNRHSILSGGTDKLVVESLIRHVTMSPFQIQKWQWSFLKIRIIQEGYWINSWHSEKGFQLFYGQTFDHCPSIWAIVVQITLPHFSHLNANGGHWRKWKPLPL